MNRELAYLLDKIVLFDIDGTLMRYDFGALGKGFLIDEWLDLNAKCNMYLERGNKTSIFDGVVQALGNNAWVATVSLSTCEQQNKIEAIKTLYPTIPENHIMFCSDTKYKVPFILSLIKANKIHNPENKKIVLVDDTADLIYDLKSRYPHGDTPFEIRLVSDFI